MTQASLLSTSPFDQSTVPPSADEARIAGLIWDASREKPVTLSDLCHATDINERTVKGIVADLRLKHRCPIGARRGKPAGYFPIRSIEDAEAAANEYRAQMVTEAKVLRVLLGPHRMRELMGQVAMEAEA